MTHSFLEFNDVLEDTPFEWLDKYNSIITQKYKEYMGEVLNSLEENYPGITNILEKYLIMERSQIIEKYKPIWEKYLQANRFENMRYFDIGNWRLDNQEVFDEEFNEL